MKIIRKSAIFSDCRSYRYSLTRTWDVSKKYVLFIGLNPSTADENYDDPTIRRCVDYAHRWGYGGLVMTNLFAFRATLPIDLKNAKFPIGEQNNQYIINLHKNSGLTVAAWGNDGCFKERDKEVISLVTKLVCLKINKTGQPAHPLYQNKATKLINYPA